MKKIIIMALTSIISVSLSSSVFSQEKRIKAPNNGTEIKTVFNVTKTNSQSVSIYGLERDSKHAMKCFYDRTQVDRKDGFPGIKVVVKYKDATEVKFIGGSNADYFEIRNLTPIKYLPKPDAKKFDYKIDYDITTDSQFKQVGDCIFR